MLLMGLWLQIENVNLSKNRPCPVFTVDSFAIRSVATKKKKRILNFRIFSFSAAITDKISDCVI